MHWILPIWIIRIGKLFCIAELSWKERLTRTAWVLLGGLVAAYAALLVVLLIKGKLLCYWLTLEDLGIPLRIPLPVFAGWLANTLMVLYLNLVVNVLSREASHYMSIKDRWQLACIRCGLLMPGLEGVKEYPHIVAAGPDWFRIEAKGQTASVIEARKSSLSNAAGILIWSARETRNDAGEVVPGLIDIFYTTKDLPASVPFEKVPLPRWGHLTFGLGIKGFQTLALTDIIHAGIAGLPGSGKSVQLRSLIVQSMLVHPHSVCVGLDFKQGAEFHVFSRLGNFILCDGYEKAAVVLDELYAEYQRRAELVRRTEVENVYQIRGPNGERVNPVFVFGDEMAEMFYSLGKHEDKETIEAQKVAIDRLSKLARLARFAGIHLILATQRPDAKAIDPQVRSMLKTRMAFKLSQKEDSILWLNRAAALELPNIPGRMLLATEAGVFEQLQGLYLDKHQAKKLLSKLPRGGSALHRRIMERLNKQYDEIGCAQTAGSEAARGRAS